MLMYEYQNQAFGYAKFQTDDYPFVALSEEVGEVSGKLAKAVRKYGSSLDQVVKGAASPVQPPELDLRCDLRKELGDVLWNLAACCTVLGMSLEDVAQMNLDKLANRDANNTIVGEGDNR